VPPDALERATSFEIDVFHTHLQAFLQPQPGAVEKNHDHPHDSVKVLHDASDLVAAEDHRHTNRHPSARHAFDGPHAQDVAIQKQQGAERLILCRALIRRFVASQVRNALISVAPISEGCRFR
jgi:hypothetical protein